MIDRMEAGFPTRHELRSRAETMISYPISLTTIVAAAVLQREHQPFH
ncbi:hypothetical protein HFO56_03290 [Rhizobium laguerreae]|nr:hypothetical protein [Rhizobium laguerreae]MBY3151412.1 hypothetical protein [Rhizobium laguerreae]